MNEKIKANLNNPEILEKMYREDRKGFKTGFETIYTGLENNEAAKFWKARLDYDIKTDILRSFSFAEISLVLAVCIATSFLIKIPSIFHLGYSDELYYEKNAGIIVFFGLALYTILSQRIHDIKKLIITSLTFLIPVIYVNLLPSDATYSSVNLVYIHLPLLMWFIYGIVATGFDLKNIRGRIEFIRFNGDMAIIYALIAIAGGLLTAITIGLFESIGLAIGEFYTKYIVISGVFAAPVVASYIIEKYPSLVSRTAPLIAGIFSPIVLITLLVFIASIVITGKDPYNDRDFLLIFNVMLLGVMAIIIFSVSETSELKSQRFNAIILFALSLTAIITDLIALSAIFYRLGQFGLSPNRVAVLVSNLLVFVNLVMIMFDLYKINFRQKSFTTVEMTVAKYLPVYLIWIAIVVFTFPLIFNLK
jgi:hypothetical protein